MKKKIKRQVDSLKALITDLTERIESLEKELGLTYVTEWEEVGDRSPLKEGLPLHFPILKPVKRHVKAEPIKWERYTKLPKVEEVQNERKTSAESSEQTT